MSIRGEVDFQAGGEGYTFLLDFNALCDLEEDMPGLMDGKVELKSPKLIRKVFLVGLQARHPDLSEQDAGAIVHDVGLEKAADLIGQSFKASFPAAKDGKAPPQKQSPGAGSGR